MMFTQAILAKVKRGEVSIAFRRWTKPSVKVGGTRVTSIGQLAIDGIEAVDLETLTEADARAAGEDSLDDMLAILAKGRGEAHRITFHLAGADPRLALRADADLGADDRAGLIRRLTRMDGATPWTGQYLRLIRDHPGRRAGDLAPMAGLATADFKIRVRRLKALGLTISLDVGYRLSPRGEVVLGAMEDTNR